VPSPVVIVRYDPDWPKIYEEESRLIRDAVGGIILSLEQVGSTSVPGLWAKPIIDIIAGVKDSESADRCRVILYNFGYDDASPGDQPDWFYCLGKATHSSGFHLHLVKEGSSFQLRHILFRDWLRSHPFDAEAYMDLKINLSEKYRDDRVAYTQSKTDFINGIVEKAEKLGFDYLLE
jgi:GrpB-like predicted nucleotidyltransferase (UPF0157 family)